MVKMNPKQGWTIGVHFCDTAAVPYVCLDVAYVFVVINLENSGWGHPYQMNNF